MVDIVWSAMVTVIAFGILYHRVVFKNQQIFDTTGRFPRPKSIESMALFGGFFNLFRLIQSTILVTDVVKNGIFRSFMFELSWQFGIIALACYLFGVVHTLACSSKAIYMSWVKSQMLVDVACIVMVISPFIVIMPMSIVAGYYAQVENIEKAIIFTNIIYFLWLAFTFLLGCMVLLAGLRLLKLLKNHLSIQKKGRNSKEEKEKEENHQKMKLGVTKVKMIIAIGCTCLWAYSITIAIYVTSRHSVMSDTKFTIVFTAFAFLNGPLASSLIQLAVLMDLKLFRGLSYLSFTLPGTTSSSTPIGSAAYNNYNTSTYMSERDYPHYNTTIYDGIVESTDAPEFISMDQWNQIFNKENNIDSLPLAQQQQQQQQQKSKLSSFGHVLSNLSPMQKKQSYIMMDNGVDNRSSSSLSYSNLEKGRY
ncbi:unnamed protein product [Cunninghamella echinulata]